MILWAGVDSVGPPSTPGSMNSLFSDFVREFGRDILGGVRDYLGEIWGSFYGTNERNIDEHLTRKKSTNIEHSLIKTN